MIIQSNSSFEFGQKPCNVPVFLESNSSYPLAWYDKNKLKQNLTNTICYHGNRFMIN